MAKTPGKTADVATPYEPPFSTGGKTTMAASGAGGRDFTKESRSQGGEGGSGGETPRGAGRDFSAEHRPQGTYAKEEVKPNPQEIPSGMGGKILKADPGAVSQKVSGTAKPLANPKPFKLKG